jgi:hypothetical protein
MMALCLKNANKKNLGEVIKIPTREKCQKVSRKEIVNGD